MIKLEAFHAGATEDSLVDYRYFMPTKINDQWICYFIEDIEVDVFEYYNANTVEQSIRLEKVWGKINLIVEKVSNAIIASGDFEFKEIS